MYDESPDQYDILVSTNIYLLKLAHPNTQVSTSNQNFADMIDVNAEEQICGGPKDISAMNGDISAKETP